MNLVEAVIVGALQGVAEWLPVSSEAVITLALTRVLGAEPLAAVGTAVWLHLGTMLAATVYFRDEIGALLQETGAHLRDGDISPFIDGRSVLSFLFLATLLTGAVGGVVYLGGVATVAGAEMLFAALTGVALLLTGVLQLYRSAADRDATALTGHDAWIAGSLQGLAIIPGISRSGITVFALFARDFSAESAFRLSFLLSIPAVLAANIGLQLVDGVTVTGSLLVAAGTAFVVGYAAIDAVLRIADRAAVAYLCFLLAAISLLPVLATV